MQWRVHEDPGRRFPIRQPRRSMNWQAVSPIAMRRRAEQGPLRIARPGEYGDWHHFHNRRPITPAGQLNQIIRPHDPHETMPRMAVMQRPQGISGVSGTNPGLNIRNHDPRVLCNLFSASEPIVKRGHSIDRL